MQSNLIFKKVIFFTYDELSLYVYGHLKISSLNCLFIPLAYLFNSLFYWFFVDICFTQQVWILIQGLQYAYVANLSHAVFNSVHSDFVFRNRLMMLKKNYLL